MRVRSYVFLCLLLASPAASAQTEPGLDVVSPAPPPRRVRDRFSRTILFGATAGVGSPRGIAGAFLELRPWRAFGVSVGGGAGGIFGPGIDVSAVLAPVGGISWAIGVEGSYSHQFGYGLGVTLPDGRALPSGSNWASAGVALEFRPSRSSMVRLGAGRTWLLNTADFGIFTRTELDYVQNEVGAIVPGATPLDAARAALDGQTLSMWYVHLDVSPAWRW